MSSMTYDSKSQRKNIFSSPNRSWRMWSVGFVFCLLTLLVLIRLLSHQIFSWGKSGRVIVPPHQIAARGVIVDRDGELLAADHYAYQITTTPVSIDSDDARMWIAQRLEDLIGLPAYDTWRILDERKDKIFARLAAEISLEDGQRIKDAKSEATQVIEENSEYDPRLDYWNYIYLKPSPVRYYPQGALGSQLLGMVRSDREAYYGIEGYYDRFLRGDGVGLTSKTDLVTQQLDHNLRRYIPSLADKDLVLTIDRTIQWIIEDGLRDALSNYGAQSGSVIVMDPDSGALLGIANWPTYNPNNYSTYEADQQRRFSNPAISDQYEPGSIFKIITNAAALDTATITPTTVFTDDGIIFVGGRPILNSNRQPTGRVDATRALAKSLNVVTAQIALRTGADHFYRYLHLFGFGEATRVDLAGEINGLLKEPGHPDWSESDLGTNSFGQGLAVTPIQMLAAAGSIANGGLLMRPYLVDMRIMDNQIQKTQPTLIRRTIQPETADQLTEMMIQVVEIGNRQAGIQGYKIAGKSGTAQIPTKDGYTEDETIVSFVGFAPADDPQFVMLVKLDRPDPTISTWAAYTAAPAFSYIAQNLLAHLNIPPDEIRVQSCSSANCPPTEPQPIEPQPTSLPSNIEVIVQNDALNNQRPTANSQEP